MKTFYDVFNPQDNLIKEFEHWVVLFRDNHVTLGSCVFILKRNIPSLAGMTAEESAELPKVIEWFEAKTKGLYGAEKFNYMALMMKDPFVHFHAFARYSKQVKKYGVEWNDVSWPKVLDLMGSNKCDEKVKLQIQKDMKE